jgi:UDP-glucose 4-epimerase
MRDMPSLNILVTGGAGYIGGHTVLALRDAGFGVIVLDDLSSGSVSLMPTDVFLIPGDVGDKALIADNSRILATLDRKPAYADPNVIASTALAWRRHLAAGHPDRIVAQDRQDSGLAVRSSTA